MTTISWHFECSKIKDCFHAKNVISWIIDTGVLHHVTRNLFCLINVKKTTIILVGLSNVKDITATKKGSMILDGGLQVVISSIFIYFCVY